MATASWRPIVPSIEKLCHHIDVMTTNATIAVTFGEKIERIRLLSVHLHLTDDHTVERVRERACPASLIILDLGVAP